MTLGEKLAGIPKQSVSHLKAMLAERREAWPDHVINRLDRLASDPRLTEFWAWYEGVVFTGPGAPWPSFSVAEQINRACRLPGKPGNLTPRQREAYFEKVRKHANALRELLQGTRFDQDYSREMTEKALSKTLDQALYPWGEDEEEDGHVVAYRVTPEGRFELPYDYPDTALTDTLGSLVEWTYWDDNWDGRVFGSSLPIAQANSEGLPVVYFTCTMFDWFKFKGVDLPFTHLATLANVALALPAEAQVSEDTVRKQVRRYEARVAQRESWLNADWLHDAPGEAPF